MSDDCGKTSQRTITRTVFVVERWCNHLEDWASVKEFNVYHGDDVGVIRGQAVEYRSRFVRDKMRVTRIERTTVTTDVITEVIES